MANTYIVPAKTVSQLKQRARELKKSAGIPHHEALDQAAQSIGLPHWHRLTELADITARTEEAYLRGLIVALDFKDAGGFDTADLFVHDPQAIYFCEQDLLAAYRRQSEAEGFPATEEDVEEYRLYELGDYVFFRFLGGSCPKTLTEVMALVEKHCFWPPVYVWLHGQMHDTYWVDAVDSSGQVAGIRF